MKHIDGPQDDWYVDAKKPKIIPELPDEFQAEQGKIKKELAYLKERNLYYLDEIEELAEFVHTSKREKVLRKRMRLRDEVDMNRRRIKVLEERLAK